MISRIELPFTKLVSTMRKISFRKKYKELSWYMLTGRYLYDIQVDMYKYTLKFMEKSLSGNVNVGFFNLNLELLSELIV